MMTTNTKNTYFAPILAVRDENQTMTKQAANNWPVKVVDTLPKSSTCVYYPYLTIKNMVQQGSGSFVQAAVEYLDKKVSSHRIAETSCILNLLALSIIFLGASEASKITALLSFSHKQPVDFVLPNGELWRYYIDYLFSGAILMAYNIKDLEGSHLEAMKMLIRQTSFRRYYETTLSGFIQCYQTKSIEDSSNSQVNPIIIGNLNHALKWLHYDFNKVVLDIFKNDLASNSQHVSEKVSFVYFVAMLMPNNYPDPDIEGGKSSHKTFYHALTIEQFQSPSGVAHRIYQSWINAMTLRQYFQHKQYRDCHEGCLSLEQMRKYLTDLGKILSPNIDASISFGLQQRCFGVGTRFPIPPYYYDESQKTLKGISLRYIGRKICPQDAVKNYNEFIKNHMSALTT